jgi:two-component system KDP operon response regulator KdpE
VTKEPLILIVDDEPPIRAFLRAALTGWGYACEEASTADAALSLAASLHPDLVLLDLGLPDLDGKEVAERLRGTPIIVLSARDQEQEKVAALDAGADDYLTKPFGLDELGARIRASLRRRAPAVRGPLRFGALTWDVDARRVFLEGTEAHLTPVEYRLFAVLASHPGRILTHGRLLQDVWGLSSLESAHYVRVAMAALRKKLERAPGQPGFIRTEVGTGYRFMDPSD